MVKNKIQQQEIKLSGLLRSVFARGVFISKGSSTPPHLHSRFIDWTPDWLTPDFSGRLVTLLFPTSLCMFKVCVQQNMKDYNSAQLRNIRSHFILHFNSSLKGSTHLTAILLIMNVILS